MDVPQKDYAIPNELCRRAGVAASSISINKFGLFPYNHITPNVNKPSMFAPCDSNVQEIRASHVLFDPILRKLVNEANGTFINLQNIVEQENIDLRSELLKICRQYRSIIRACLENLREECEKASKERKEVLSEYLTIFYSIECAWHLCEILYIDLIPGKILLPHLLEWIRFHIPKHERNAAIILSGDLENAETNKKYWDTVIGNFLQGRIDIARTLLKIHSNADNVVFKLVDYTLKTMPIFDVYGGISINEFNVKRKQWQVDLQSKIDAQSFIKESNLDLMMRLAVGEEEAWEIIRPECEEWYEMLTYWLYFTEPTIKSFELGDFAQKWLYRCVNNFQVTQLDNVILAAFEFNIDEVIRQIQLQCESGWFATHLIDLFYHYGILDNLNSEKDPTRASYVRETFLLEYATIVCEHRSLWQVGISYLDYCPVEGIHRIESLLERLPLETEGRTLKIIAEAEKRDLTNLVSSICKIRGLMALRIGRIGNALTWSVRSHDSSLATFLADKLLRDYTSHGKLDRIDFLDNLGASMIISDKLLFLGKYLEFQSEYRSNNLKDASDILAFLMASKTTPKYFWKVLFMDAIPLLECDQLVMSTNNTVLIMHCLEEYQVPSDDDKIRLLRSALARNLARAIIYDAQTM